MYLQHYFLVRSFKFRFKIYFTFFILIYIGLCRQPTDRDYRRRLQAWFWNGWKIPTAKIIVQLSLSKRASKYLIACSLKAGFKVKQQFKATKWMRVVRVQPPSISWTSGLNFIGSVTIPLIDQMIKLIETFDKGICWD